MTDRELLNVIAWFVVAGFLLQLLIAFSLFWHLGRVVAAFDRRSDPITGEDVD